MANVECGARLDIRDTVHNGMPLRWAEFAGRTRIAEYLRARSNPAPEPSPP